MIRVNDRMDPQAGWVDIPGAELADITGSKRTFTVPQGEFSARLATAGAASSRFIIMIGDPDDTTEGIAPDVWTGVVESWQPAGSRLRVVCRPARTVQEVAATLIQAPDPSGPTAPLTGGIG